MRIVYQKIVIKHKFHFNQNYMRNVILILFNDNISK